jgi:hypothetical protein
VERTISFPLDGRWSITKRSGRPPDQVAIANDLRTALEERGGTGENAPARMGEGLDDGDLDSAWKLRQFEHCGGTVTVPARRDASLPAISNVAGAMTRTVRATTEIGPFRATAAARPRMPDGCLPATVTSVANDPGAVRGRRS